MSWLDHFGLSQMPFTKEIADGELWLPQSKREVVAEILAALEARQPGVLLVGDPGVGKTCVLRALRHQLPAERFRLTYCHNATLGRHDFYRQLCVALGIEVKATPGAMFYAVGKHVETLAAERQHPVLLLDEAHMLNPTTLQHLHILSNYGWDSQALISLVLVGLPELWSTLTLRQNRSLWSRIHCRIDLGEASSSDTAEYLSYRLERVGGGQTLIASDAILLLHEASQGRLRDIDRLTTASLHLAAARKLTRVDRHIVGTIVERQERRQ